MTRWSSPRFEDALDVFDFEAVARRTLPPAHFGYLATGTDATTRAREPGVVRPLSASRPAAGQRRQAGHVGQVVWRRYDSPIVLAPVSSQRAFYPEGEIAVAKAARAQKHLQILSTMSSTAVEAVNAARGEPVWFQLYPTNDWNVTTAIVERAEKAGCPVLVLTVDNLGNNRVTQRRLTRLDTRTCQSCHATPPSTGRFFVTRPIFSGIDMSRAERVSPQDWNWNQIDRLRALTKMKLVIKGLVTREDADLARTARRRRPHRVEPRRPLRRQRTWIDRVRARSRRGRGRRSTGTRRQRFPPRH